MLTSLARLPTRTRWFLASRGLSCPSFRDDAQSWCHPHALPLPKINGIDKNLTGKCVAMTSPQIAMSHRLVSAISDLMMKS